MIPEYMTTPITNNEQAKKYICDLYFDHNLYHLDEFAEDIVSFKTNKPAFTPEECVLLNQRRDEVFEHMEIDPHQLCCSLTDLKL
jgi:hypothetical protein